MEICFQLSIILKGSCNFNFTLMPVNKSLLLLFMVQSFPLEYRALTWHATFKESKQKHSLYVVIQTTEREETINQRNEVEQNIVLCYLQANSVKLICQKIKSHNSVMTKFYLLRSELVVLANNIYDVVEILIKQKKRIIFLRGFYQLNFLVFQKIKRPAKSTNRCSSFETISILQELGMSSTYKFCFSHSLVHNPLHTCYKSAVSSCPDVEVAAKRNL